MPRFDQIINQNRKVFKPAQVHRPAHSMMGKSLLDDLKKASKERTKFGGSDMSMWTSA